MGKWGLVSSRDLSINCYCRGARPTWSEMFAPNWRRIQFLRGGIGTEDLQGCSTASHPNISKPRHGWPALSASTGQWDQAATYATRYCDRTRDRQLTAAQTQTRRRTAPGRSPSALPTKFLRRKWRQKGSRRRRSALLRSALARYGNTSIRARLQKNLNLLALVGQPAPPLQVTQYLGPKPPTLASLKGSPVLLFFWAHWCVDCKAEVPVIARLRQEFAPEGLVVIGPTQLYGYAAQGADATPERGARVYRSRPRRYYCQPAQTCRCR